MIKTLDNVGIPKQSSSDQDGSFKNVEFINLMDKRKIKQIMTVGSAHTVEDANRQFEGHMQHTIRCYGFNS